MGTVSLTREQAADRIVEIVRGAHSSPVLTYTHDPERFVLECFQWPAGEGPSGYQREILRELKGRKRLAIRGPHGLGKTALAAWVVLWFALTRDASGTGDWKAVITASAWRQLSHYLAPEIHKWSRRLLWEKVGRAAFDGRLTRTQGFREERAWRFARWACWVAG